MNSAYSFKGTFYAIREPRTDVFEVYVRRTGEIVEIYKGQPFDALKRVNELDMIAHEKALQPSLFDQP